MDFGLRLRELRQQKCLTLRQLADATHLDFTYLSKIENGKAGYLPAADSIRVLAEALEADSLELLQLAKKVPPELEQVAGNTNARKFFQRAQEIASPEDWDELLSVLELRQVERKNNRKRQK